MLPRRLLDCDRTDDGRVVPRWLLPRDEPWLRELVHEASAAGGRIAAEVDERIVDTVAPVARRHGAGRRLVEAAWTVERRRWSLRTASPVPPRTIRRIVFELAAERSREEALATAAAELGLDGAQIEALLFADCPRAKLLVAPGASATTSSLADAYNLAIVQSLLGRATEVACVVRANLRRVVGYAKLLGLMMTFDEAEDGAATMTLSGPMALFHDTVKYGNALARWFPALVATPGWSLRASVVLSGETLRFDLGAESPLPRTHAMPRAHDSRLESKLESDLRRMASPWRIAREVAVVAVAPGNDGRRKLLFPDFALSSDRGRVLVEVVGYWTKDYLEGKRAMLNAARVPLVMCVDERHADPDLTADPRVVPFKKWVDVHALLRACERALE
jgi:predicted nuclease of restriction endonuclease-like RecB superfamily